MLHASKWHTKGRLSNPRFRSLFIQEPKYALMILTHHERTDSMASYKNRGNKHNVIYNYKSPADNKQKVQWETYLTAREAIQRKAQIDFLQKSKLYDEVYTAVLEYKDQRAAMAAENEAEKIVARYRTAPDEPSCPYPRGTDNTHKTYREFAEEWLPFHARKKRYAPTTYDGYHSMLTAHILPYFGERIMSRITARDIDSFVTYLSYKPVQGNQYNATVPEKLSTLSSSVVKKAHQVLMAGFPTAKKWGFVNEIPISTVPTEKYNRRKAWSSKEMFNYLGQIKDRDLHLIVHLAFVCSLRAGELAGIDLTSIDLEDQSLWIRQEIQRISDRAFKALPKNEIIHLFPNLQGNSKSHLILKLPKTKESYRKVYLTKPLCEEIKERLAQIQKNKDYLGSEYDSYNLLICRPTGFPMDPKHLSKIFKAWQTANQVENPICLQGLRKSGQIHKVRVSQNDYQLVAEAAGHTPKVLMSNYNEIHDSEKRMLSTLVEKSFYPAFAADLSNQ